MQQEPTLSPGGSLSSRVNRQGWAKRLGRKTGLLFKGWSPWDPLILLQKDLLAEGTRGPPHQKPTSLFVLSSFVTVPVFFICGGGDK